MQHQANYLRFSYKIIIEICCLFILTCPYTFPAKAYNYTWPPPSAQNLYSPFIGPEIVPYPLPFALPSQYLISPAFYPSFTTGPQSLILPRVLELGLLANINNFITLPLNRNSLIAGYSSGPLNPSPGSGFAGAKNSLPTIVSFSPVTPIITTALSVLPVPTSIITALPPPPQPTIPAVTPAGLSVTTLFPPSIPAISPIPLTLSPLTITQPPTTVVSPLLLPLAALIQATTILPPVNPPISTITVIPQTTATFITLLSSLLF